MPDPFDAIDAFMAGPQEQPRNNRLDSAFGQLDAFLGNPDWSNKAIPEQDRLDDFLRNQARRNPSRDQAWEAASGEIGRHFPNADRTALRERFANIHLGESLISATNAFRNRDRNTQQEWGRYAIQRTPGVGAVDKAMDFLEVKASAERLNSREYSQRDIERVARFLGEAEESRNRTVLEQAGNILSELPAFVLEMLVTAGAFSAGKAVATRAGTAMAGGAVESMAGRAAQGAAGYALGTALQTAAMPHRVAESAARLSVPGMTVGESGFQTQDRGSFASNLPWGFLDTFIEIGTERAGDLLPARLTGGSRGVASSLRQLGQHGPVAELLEERLGEALRGLTGLAKKPDGTADYGVIHGLFDGRAGESGRQLFAETIAFAAIPVAGRAAELAMSRQGLSPQFAQQRLQEIETTLASSATRQEAQEKLDQMDLPKGPVQDFAQAVVNIVPETRDSQLRARAVEPNQPQEPTQINIPTESPTIAPGELPSTSGQIPTTEAQNASAGLPERLEAPVAEPMRSAEERTAPQRASTSAQDLLSRYILGDSSVSPDQISAAGKLTEQQAAVFFSRLALNEEKMPTFEAVGKSIGVKKQYAQEIEKAAMKKLGIKGSMEQVRKTLKAMEADLLSSGHAPSAKAQLIQEKLMRSEIGSTNKSSEKPLPDLPETEYDKMVNKWMAEMDPAKADALAAKIKEYTAKQAQEGTLFAPPSTPHAAPGPVSGPPAPGPYNLRKFINALFKLPEYIGKTTQAANAQYETRAKQLITSGQMVGDTPQRIHELAHHLTHSTKAPIKLDPTLLPADVVQGFREYDYVPNRPQLDIAMQEGFAEWLRQRVTGQTAPVSPAMAAAAQWAEDAIAKKGHTKNLDRVQQAYAMMTRQSPADLARGMASPTGQAPDPGLSATEGMARSAESKLAEIQRLTEHRLLPADQLNQARTDAGMPDLPKGQDLSAVLEVAAPMPDQWAARMATDGVLGFERGPDGKWREKIISNGGIRNIFGPVLDQPDLLSSKGRSLLDAMKKFAGLPVVERSSWIGTFILGRNVVDKMDRGIAQSLKAKTPQEIAEAERNMAAVSKDQAKAYREFLTDVETNNPALYAKAMEVYHRYTTFTDALLEARVMDGSMTRRQADAWRKAEPNYVSLARVMENGGYTIAIGKERHGSGRQLIDPAETLEHLIRVRANETARRMIDAALVQSGQHDGAAQIGVSNMFREVKNPKDKDAVRIGVEERLEALGYDPAARQAIMSVIGTEFIQEKPWRDGAQNTYTAKVDGKDYVLEFANKPLYDLVAGRTGANSDNRLVSAAAKLASLPGLKQLTEFVKFGAVGANLRFPWRNIVRDPWNYAMNVMGRGRGFTTDVLNFLRGHKTAFQGKYEALIGQDISDPMFKNYDEAGGEGLRGPYALLPTGKGEAAWREVRGETGWKDKTIRAIEKTKDLLELWGAGEHGPRFAEYENALTELGYTKQQIQAARNANPFENPIAFSDHIYALQRASRSTTQFTRQGELTHEWNKITPFMTPVISGLSQEGRNWKGVFQELGSGVIGPKTKAMAGTLAVLTAAHFLHHFLFRDKEWYKNLPEHLRYQWWVLYQDSSGGVWGIPKPQGLLNLWGAYVQESLRATDGTEPRFGMAAHNVVGQSPRVLPVGIAEGVQVYVNRDWAGRPIVPTRDEHTPDFDQWMNHRLPYVVEQLSGGLLSSKAIRPPWEAFRSSQNEPTQPVQDYYEELRKLQSDRNRAGYNRQAFPGERRYQQLHSVERRMSDLGRETRGERLVNGRVVAGEKPSADRLRQIRQEQIRLANRALGKT